MFMSANMFPSINWLPDCQEILMSVSKDSCPESAGSVTQCLLLAFCRNSKSLSLAFSVSNIPSWITSHRKIIYSDCGSRMISYYSNQPRASTHHTVYMHDSEDKAVKPWMISHHCYLWVWFQIVDYISWVLVHFSSSHIYSFSHSHILSTINPISTQFIPTPKARTIRPFC